MCSLKSLHTVMMAIFVLSVFSCTSATVTNEATPSLPSQEGVIYYSQRQGGNSASMGGIGGLYFSDLAGNETYLTESSHISEFDTFSWSPVTKQLLYADWMEEPYTESNMELYLLSPPGEKKRLTNNDNMDSDGKWSPDGRKIAFVSSEGDDWFYMMNPDGTNKEPVLDEELEAIFGFDYAWSPDSKKIAISTIDPNTTDVNSPPTNIRIVEIDSGSVSPKLEDWARVDFDWSPDSNHLVYLSDVVSLDASTNGYQSLYILDTESNKEEHLVSFGLIGSPKWSPVADIIAFSAIDTEKDPTADRFDLYLINRDGSNLRQLTDDHSYRVGAWSPDGTQLALMSLDGLPSDFEIYVFDIVSETLTQITYNDVMDAYPIWAELPRQ